MIEQGDDLKKDYGKIAWHLMPMKAVAEIVKILMFGAEKYAPEGWKELIHDRGRVEDALMRHVIAHKEGEVLDPETGRPHMAHAGCNVIFLLWFWLQDEAIQESKELGKHERTRIIMEEVIKGTIEIVDQGYGGHQK